VRKEVLGGKGKQKRRSPKTAPLPARPVFRCASRQVEPPQILLSEVLSLAPDYRREMHIFPAPRSRSGDTPVPAVTCFGPGCCCTAALFLSGAVECPLSTDAVLYDLRGLYKVMVRVARSGCLSDPPVQPDYRAHPATNS